MKIYANQFDGKDVRVSLQAENEAEKHQLESIKGQLKDARAMFGEWKSEEFDEGLTIIAYMEKT